VKQKDVFHQIGEVFAVARKTLVSGVRKGVGRCGAIKRWKRGWGERVRRLTRGKDANKMDREGIKCSIPERKHREQCVAPRAQGRGGFFKKGGGKLVGPKGRGLGGLYLNADRAV